MKWTRLAILMPFMAICIALVAAEGATNSVRNVAADITVPANSAVSTEPTSLAGSWSLYLSDKYGASRTATITLFQSGDAVFGTGKLAFDATTTPLNVAASGTVTGDKLNLDLVSLGRVKLYRISMTVSGDSAIGSYITYSPIAAQITGTVKIVRSIPI